MQQTGFKKSAKSKKDYVFEAKGFEYSLPAIYSYKNFLPDILNQESDPICVPCSLSTYLNWRESLLNGKKKDYEIDYYELYDIRADKGEGMTFKEAFSFLRHEGVSSDLGKLKIGTYAKVTSSLLLKYAIFLNGPCVAALPLYNGNNEFWKKGKNDILNGYHAISLIGYDESGFIIRNSWGKDYGEGGYSHINEKDFNRFVEIWTITG